VNLAILVPMLRRHHLVPRLLDSIRATCEARVLWLTTPGDTEVATAVDAVGGEQLPVDWQPAGDYARKVNAGYRATTEELLFLGAIDLVFRPGWFEAATARLAPGIGVVGTNDLGSARVMAGQHATHSLVTRAYADQLGTIDRPGEILHEGYVHEYVDDELVATAKHRRAWAFAADSHVEHLHPNWGKAPMDDLYAQQGERMRRSGTVFRQRSRLWR
jgi:hypothetical protein